jgi:hypothetical protein
METLEKLIRDNIYLLAFLVVAVLLLEILRRTKLSENARNTFWVHLLIVILAVGTYAAARWAGVPI